MGGGGGSFSNGHSGVHHDYEYCGDDGGEGGLGEEGSSNRGDDGGKSLGDAEGGMAGQYRKVCDLVENVLGLLAYLVKIYTSYIDIYVCMYTYIYA